MNGEHRASSAMGNIINLLNRQNSDIRVKIGWTLQHLLPAMLLGHSRQTGYCYTQFEMDLSVCSVLNSCDLFMSWLKVRLSAFNQMRLRNYVTRNIQNT